MPRNPAILDTSPEQTTARRLADLEQSTKQRRAAKRSVYVTGEYIVPNTIENKHIKTETIEAEKLNVKELSAISAKLGTVTAGTIKSSVLIEGVLIKGTTIEGGTVKGVTVEGTTVKGGTIEGGTIKGATIEGSTVIKAPLIEGGTLKGGTIEGGTLIKAPTIEGGTLKGAVVEGTTLKSVTAEGATTITGATIKTSSGTARVEINSTSIKGVNAAGVTKFLFDVTSGILTATAVISAEEGSVIPTKLLAGQIKETQIEEGAISTPLLQANAVTAKKISVENLAAIKSDLGEIVAGSLTAVTIKSATIEGTTIKAGSIHGATLGLEQQSSPKTASSLTWDASGTVTQYVSAYGVVGEYRDIVIGTGSGLNIASGESAMRLQSSDVGSAAFDQAILQTGTVLKTVMNGLEESSFLQLTGESPEKRKVAMGSSTVTYPGLSNFSNGKTITHGLGVTPKAVSITGEVASPGLLWQIWRVSNLGATTFEVSGYSPQGAAGAGATAVFYWIAIG